MQGGIEVSRACAQGESPVPGQYRGSTGAVPGQRGTLAVQDLGLPENATKPLVLKRFRTCLPGKCILHKVFCTFPKVQFPGVRLTGQPAVESFELVS